jgi:exosome complex RNA-binding protein Rrp42 (RNase PH superfamily)
MQTIKLSQGEKLFQEDLLNQKIRLDGRHPLDARPFTIEMNPLRLAPASCRVLWGHGYSNTTEVLVAVNTEITKSELSQTQISVKALAGAFGPVADSEQICQVIKASLMHLLENSKALEPSQFSVSQSPFSWKIFIDVLIVRAAGGFYEASMIGIRESLRVLTFPQAIVTPGESLAELHFDIDETKEAIKIIDENRLPFILSFSASLNALLLDPTPLEVSVLQSLLVVGISRDGMILGMNHFGECGLRSWTLGEATEQAKQILGRYL